MFSQPRSFRRRVNPQPVAGEVDVAHLRLVDADVYTDWESVYRDNVDRLYRLMYARVGNRPDAEDLTSEVFRTALGPLRLASSKGEVRSYLLATARTVPRRRQRSSPLHLPVRHGHAVNGHRPARSPVAASGCQRTDLQRSHRHRWRGGHRQRPTGGLQRSSPHTFIQDSPGRVTGQGVQNFFVATPGITTNPAASTSGSSTPAPASNAYGY